MSLEGEILSFVGEKWQNLLLLGRTREWYQYQKLVVPVPIGQRQSGTGTGASNNPVFVPFAPLSLVFVHRLFRDPNKGLMGVHIRVYERENVPYLASTIFV